MKTVITNSTPQVVRKAVTIQSWSFFTFKMIQTQLPFPADGESNSELEDAHKHVADMDIKVKGRKSPLSAARGALFKIGPPKMSFLAPLNISR